MAISALVLATLLAARQDGAESPLDWLHGTWVCRLAGTGAGAVLRREHWQGDGWSGTHVRVDEVRAGPGGEALPLSSGRILADNGGFSLLHRMQGASTGAPASYRSVRVGAREAEFVTDEAVAPQRIVYRRTGTALTVTHSRRDGSGARSWRMLPEGSGHRGCDGRR